MSGPADYYSDGDWNITCSLCGRKLKASRSVKNWQGYYRCPEHNEPRHPQDFVRGVKDVQTVPFSQPPTDNDLAICDYNGISALAGYAVATCMITGRTQILPPDPRDL